MAAMDIDPQTRSSFLGCVYNEKLPYADRIQGEYLELLAEIKEGLVSGIKCRELAPGTTFWFRRLNEYVDQKYTIGIQRFLSLHKFNIVQEELVELCKLLFELVILPDLDFNLQEKFARVLIKLLSKDYVLPSECMELPWRPLYEILDRLYFYSARKVIYIRRDRHGDAIVQLIEHARRFFPESATAEILEAFRPLMCPHDISIFKGQGLLCLLLPTNRKHDKPAPYHLWFDEFIAMWPWIENMPSWDVQWLSLFERLAAENVGHMEWDSLMPVLYTKFLRLLQLPVGSSAPPSPYQHKLPPQFQVLMPEGDRSVQQVNKICSLVVSFILPNNTKGLDYLSALIKAIEGFYHPSNTGSWTGRLAAFMNCLVGEYSGRIHEEKETSCLAPHHARLTDNETRQFVQIMKPILLMSLFAKSSQMVIGAADALKTVGYLAPELIFPDLLDRIYPALETLTETHQTVAALGCLMYIARPLLWRKHYPDGAQHLVSLLQLSLPGIDPNDPIKTDSTFKFYCSILANVPLVDCSNVPADAELSEQELAVAESTAYFDEWVMQLLDRIFLVCEHMVEPAKRGKRSVTTSVEANFATSVRGMCLLLFTQSSPAIMEEATNKIFRFVTSHLLMKAMKPIGHIVSSASFAHPEIILKRFVPFFADRIVDMATSHMDEEDADKELLWCLHIMSQVVKITGAAILPYADTLIEVLQCTLWSTSRNVAKLGGKLLRNVLRSLLSIYPRDYRSISPDDWADPHRLHTKYWGEAVDLDDVTVDWHVPNQDEVKFAYKLLDKFLVPAMAKLDKIVAGDTTSSKMDVDGPLSSSKERYDIWQCLIVIRNVRASASTPYLDAALNIRSDDADWAKIAAQHNDRRSVVFMSKRQLIVTPDFFPEDARVDVHYDIASTLHRLTEHLMAHREDDTKLLRLLCKTYSVVLCSAWKDANGLYGKKRMYATSKSLLTYAPGMKHRHVRWLQVMRVGIQHQIRTSRNGMSGKYTPMHYTLLEDMLKLSTNNYADVRSKAQKVLAASLRCYPGAKFDLFPKVLEYMRPDHPAHSPDSVKGALYLLQSRSFLHLATNGWEYTRDLIMALCLLQNVDKQSVQSLAHKLFVQFSLEFHTMSMSFDVNESVLNAADKLGGVSVDPATIAQGIQRAAENSTKNKQTLEELNESLVQLLLGGKLHWRYELMMSSCLIFFLREDLPPTEPVVRWFLRGLVSELAPMRRVSQKAMEAILVLQKRPVVNKEFRDLTVGDSPCPPAVYGQRPANQFYTYHGGRRPGSAAEWDAAVFIDKNYVGWNVFSKRNKVYIGAEAPLTYVPPQPQPHVHIPTDKCPPHSPSAWTPAVRAVDEFFTSPDDLAALIKYMDLEAGTNDADGAARRSDAFSETNAQLFKGVFRNGGVAVMDAVLPLLEKLCASPEKHSQKAAAEITAGFVRGSKMWPYNDLVKAWCSFGPLLSKTLAAISNESNGDWASCIRFCCYDRDPRRIQWLCDIVLELPDLKAQDLSTAAEGRALSYYQILIGELSWRGCEPSAALLEHIRQHIAHPYKLVRERMARGLYAVFRNFWSPLDMQTAPGPDEKRNEREAFVVEVMEKAMAVGEEGSSEQEAWKLCSKTVLNWLTITFHSGGSQSVLPYFHLILPPLFKMVDHGNEEVVTLAKQSLGFISQTTFPMGYLPVILSAIEHAAGTCKWHGKVMVLNFVQVMVFRNLFTLDDKCMARIVDLLLAMMVDEQLEVRQLASITVGGLIRCNARLDVSKMSNGFRELARTHAPREKGQAHLKNPNFVRRHAGVLGMSALIAAHPYDVPDFLPALLCELGDHLSDPVPIQTTVKTTLSEFWRTHQDNWQQFKSQFTEEQLYTITDLLISPYYYA